ncbi:hypothetical protein BGZ49_004315 [Haplosporangium sp. Z 27]|nr:hypothetical protein BGZ49_004315 [Haplosporangium sp. Z 27]
MPQKSINCTFQRCQQGLTDDGPKNGQQMSHWKSTHVDEPYIFTCGYTGTMVEARRNPQNCLLFTCICGKSAVLSTGSIKRHYDRCQAIRAQVQPTPVSTASTAASVSTVSTTAPVSTASTADPVSTALTTASVSTAIPISTTAPAATIAPYSTVIPTTPSTASDHLGSTIAMEELTVSVTSSPELERRANDFQHPGMFLAILSFCETVSSKLIYFTTFKDDNSVAASGSRYEEQPYHSQQSHDSKDAVRNRIEGLTTQVTSELEKFNRDIILEIGRLREYLSTEMDERLNRISEMTAMGQEYSAIPAVREAIQYELKPVMQSINAKFQLMDTNQRQQI